MAKNFLISTNHQKALSFLAKFSDKEFHEREIARTIGISYGSANRVLRDLHSDGYLIRRQAGKMLFYRFNSLEPSHKSFKIFSTIALLRPLVCELIKISYNIILFGSCAEGTEASDSDIDLFIVTGQKSKVLRIILNFSLGRGFEEIKIQPVIYSPVELMKHEKTDAEFLSLVREGIVLWEKPPDESGI
jgi:predicted nucleotidyltransferase